MAILAECPACHRKQSRAKHLCVCGEDLDRAKQSKRVHYWLFYRLGGKQKWELVYDQDTEEPSTSLQYAKDAEGKRRSQKRENRIFDIKPDTIMTFNELTEWYLNLEKVKALPSYWLIKLSLKKFNSVFGNTIISKVKSSDLENYQAKRRREGLADATIDHEIGKAKSMVNKAFENDMISGDTLKSFKVVKKLLKRNANARDRVLTTGEYESLFKHSSRHLQGILATAYYTGMREGEILNLTWDKVDLKSRLIKLEAIDTKDREPRVIPISDELYEVLNAIPRPIHDPHVFLFKGKPIRDLRTALRKACKKAEIPYGRFIKGGFVFHDLRHTFNTNMRKARVPESVIMNITGHSTREMFDRYNSIDADDTREAIGQLSSYFQKCLQSAYKTAQNDKKGLTGKPANPYLS